MGKTYKYFLLVLCMAAFVLPSIQKAFQVFPLQKFALAKAPDAPGLPPPHANTFLDNTYQDSVTRWFNATEGFRPLLVRLRNQIDYSCFHIAHGNIILGKNSCLFLQESTNCFLGLTLDSALLDRRMDTVEMLKNYLSKLNIPLLFVIAPGKGHYLSNYLPAEYLAMKKQITSYELLIQQLAVRHIDNINLRTYFDTLGVNAAYPLFPKQGMHWTTYGAALGLDTIYKKMATVLNFAPQKVDLSHVTISSQPKFPEDDLAETINKLWIAHVDTLAYPQPVCSASNSADIKKPRVLFIGDSYTYVFGFTNLPAQIFDTASKYWFYMRTEKDFNNMMKDGDDLSKKNLQSALKQFDIVVILSTDARYDYGDYGLYRMLMTEPLTP
jgi:acetyltransferase AlgX (SGNH hydrolase-like protein)